MRRSDFSNLAIALLWLASAVALLIRVYSLRFNPPESAIFFWAPYIIFISISAWLVWTREDRFPLFVILGMAFVLHLIPQVRQPSGFLWGEDGQHLMLIAGRIVETGRLDIGCSDLSGFAFAFSFYPGLELLMSFLNMLTGIPLMALYKFSFAAINIATLFSLYYLMKLIVKNPKIVNMCVFLYALSPRFHGFNSSSVHESLAIIFYPLLLSVFLTHSISPGKSQITKRYTKMLAIIFVFITASTITHHYTMYQVLFHATLIVLGTYLLGKYLRQRRGSTTPINLLLLMAITVFSWLSFIAYYFLRTHGNWLLNIIRSIQVSQIGNLVPKPYPMPALERTFTYVGVGTFLLLSLFGVYQISRHKPKGFVLNVESTPLILWWAIDAGLIGFFEMIRWQSTFLVGISDIRFRGLEFTYFGIVLMSTIGLQSLSGKLELKVKHLTGVIAILLLVLIAIPTVTIGFPYYLKDNLPSKASDSPNVYPTQQYLSSMWVKEYITDKEIAASTNFLEGYALKNLRYDLLLSSLNEHKIEARYYSILEVNLLLPDTYNFTLDPNDLIWLDNNLNRIYDNGAVFTYSAFIEETPS